MSISRQFGRPVAPPLMKGEPETKSKPTPVAKLREAVAAVSCPECERLRQEIVELRKQLGAVVLDHVDPITRSGGRPPIHADKPWEKEGVSRNTWYRRQKKDKAK